MEIPEGQDPNAGILYIPEEISFEHGREMTDEEHQAMLDAFMELLAEHLRAPLDPPDGPTTMMPLIVRTEGDLVEAQAWLAAQAAAAGPRKYLPIMSYDEWLVRGN
jgi:hypothetical protein